MSDSRNFDDFFRAFLNPCAAFIERMMGSKAEAEDLAQDVFLRVWEHWGEFETEENAKAFLYTTARYLYWNHRKHEKAHQNYLKQLSESEEDDYNFLEEVTREETIRILYAAIDKLPPRAREVILLNLEGKDNNEVAESLHISLNTVKSLKKSAYVILRKLLAKDYYLILLMLLGE